MPDITMCEGQGCPLKETCYRHTATPSKYRQSYFTKAPFVYNDNGEATCSHEWKGR